MKRKTSSTAGYTCFTRACAANEKDERYRGADDLAQIFLPAFARIVMRVPFLKKWFLGKLAPAGIYEYVIARTRLFDQFFLEALNDGVRQIVIMGAGMDTRALRFARENQGTRIFELDLPKIQQAKLNILNRKRIALPPDLTFVGIDFNHDNILRVLSAADFSGSLKSCFLLEGLTMYLDPPAVDDLVRFMRENAPKGSRVAFDYIYASVLRKEHRYYGEEGLYDTVAKAGEGWRFGIEEGALEEFLTARGFRPIAHYSPADLQEKYFKPASSRLAGRVNGTHCIALAEKN